MELSLLPLLDNLGDEYILLKRWSDFPVFLPGSDIDLLVLDRFIASKMIQKYFDPLLDRKEYFLRVTEGWNHVHLDVMHGQNIWVRFDLIDRLDIYTRFSVQDALKVKLFLCREKIVFDNYEIFVPSSEFEILIRYFEYVEYFESRPDKIKHLDYILANSTPEQQAELIKNAHRYIRFHRLEWHGKVPEQRNLGKSRKQAIKEIFLLIKKIGFISWDSFRSKLK